MPSGRPFLAKTGVFRSGTPPPFPGGNTPRRAVDTPAAPGNTPDGGGKTPDGGGKTPPAGADTPRRGGKTPPRAGETPRQMGWLPIWRREDPAPSGEDPAGRREHPGASGGHPAPNGERPGAQRFRLTAACQVIDRLCLMLLGQESIRDVILFPPLKPNEVSVPPTSRRAGAYGQRARFDEGVTFGLVRTGTLAPPNLDAAPEGVAVQFAGE